MATVRKNGNGLVKVWDPLVRIFHWSLVGFVIVALVSAEEFEGLHLIAGYAVLYLVIFRIVWGVIGTKYARFSNFIYGPATISAYLKGFFKNKSKYYLGHNPVGGIMVIALLLSLILASVSGIKAQEGEEYEELSRPSISFITTAHADDDNHHGGHHSDSHEFWEETHEIFAGLTIFLIIAHIAGALITSFYHKEGLVKAMITGRKEHR